MRVNKNKKNKKLFILVTFIIILMILAFLYFNMSSNNIGEFANEDNNNVTNEIIDNKKIIGKTDSTTIDKIYNIDECSEIFMDNYFEQISDIKQDEEEKILIVTSLNEIENSFEAKKIIPSPNNQYILQFDSREKKDIALEQLKNDNSILSVDENEVMTLFTSNYNSWGIEKMALDSTIDAIKDLDLPEVRVAIIDTGCDVNLINKYYPGKVVEVYDVLNDTTESISDTYGHGTHIAGTIAEGTPDNVKLIPIKQATGREVNIVESIAAINYIVYYDKADVINMSFGGPDYNNAFYNAIESANRKNIICVCAAGNDSSSTVNYPAGYSNTISIGSVNSELNLSSFSNYGNTVDFVAPGTSIKSTLSSDMFLSENLDGDNDFEVLSGTSMATPHAVNAIAILKSLNIDLNRENVIKLLNDYCVIDLGTFGKDNYFGNGFIYLNSNALCINKLTDECEEFGVFKSEYKNEITDFEIVSLLHTNYNFFTVNNFDPTQIEITCKNSDVKTVNLGDIREIEIEGYNPNSVEEQNITIKIEGIQKTFNFTNPDNWECGWSYSVIEDKKVKITNRTGSDTICKKLFIPEMIDDFSITDIISVGNSTIFQSCEDIILPSTLEKISGSRVFSNKGSIKKVISLAPSIDIIGESVFSNNNYLVEVEGTIGKLARSTFENDYILKSITLSDTITEIPYGTFHRCREMDSLVFPQNLVLIDDFSFYLTGIRNLDLSNTKVEEIGDNAFGESLVERVKLPDTLKIIGNNAFLFTQIIEIELPDSLEKIGWQAFLYVPIDKINIPSSVYQIGDTNFKRNDNTYITIWTEKNAYAKTYAIQYGIPYETISQPYIDCSLQEYCFEEYDTVNTEIFAYFDRGTYSDSSYVQLKGINGRKETIDPNDFEIIYQNNRDFFMMGDTSFTVQGITQYGEQFEKSFNVEVIEKNTKTVIVPDINIDDKEYDGTTSISLSSINISNLQPSDYSIVSVVSSSADVGKRTATISLRLSDDKFEEYSFIHGKQEKDFLVDFMIYKADFEFIDNTTDMVVKYDGNSHQIGLVEMNSVYNSNVNIKFMDENNEYTLTDEPIHTDIGTYIIKYMFYKDDNHEEYYGERILNIVPENSADYSVTSYEGAYDGLEHSISIKVEEIDDYSIRYSLNNLDYNLTELPTFKNVGEYTVNYKIIADGYDDITGSGRVKIYGVLDVENTMFLDDNIILVTDYDNSFSNICDGLTVYTSSYKIQHINKNGEIVSNNLTKTGDKIKIIINNQINVEYIVAILGDINEDGIINLKDWNKIHDHISDISKLTDYHLLCGDINRDGNVNIQDWNRMYEHINEVNPLW